MLFAFAGAAPVVTFWTVTADAKRAAVLTNRAAGRA
jgi:hypothetical protein